MPTELRTEFSAPWKQRFHVTLFKGTPQEKPELYRRASPITYAKQVKAPILIIQGRKIHAVHLGRLKSTN